MSVTVQGVEAVLCLELCRVGRLRYICNSAGCGGCITSVPLQGVEAALHL